MYPSSSLHVHLAAVTWRREWLPTPVFLPGEAHGQSLVGSQSKGSLVAKLPPPPPAVTAGVTGMIVQRQQKSQWFLQPGIDENQLWGLKNGDPKLRAAVLRDQTHTVGSSCSMGPNTHTRDCWWHQCLQNKAMAFEQTDLSCLNDFSTGTKMLIALVM